MAEKREKEESEEESEEEVVTLTKQVR